MTTLQDELTTGPLSAEIAPFIANGNDGAISEIMYRKDIVVKGVLTCHDVKQYLSLIGLRLPIKDSVAISCREATQALEDFKFFDLSNSLILAKFTDILDGLVAESLIPDFTETHKATLLAMGDVLVSRADQLDYPVTIETIAQALRG